MITFVYEARHNITGDEVKSEVQAETEQAAAKLLISQNLFPIMIQAKNKGGGLKNLKFGTGISSKDRVVFTRQLATLINAGLPLLQALRTVKTQIANKVFQELVGEIITSIEGGSALNVAFAAHPKVFNQVYISLVAAGETSGTLDKTLQRLALQQEKDAAVASKIRGAMVYPAIVLAVILAVIIFLMTVLVPLVAGLYKDLGKSLPLVTKILVAFSGFLTHYWWLVLGVNGFGIYALVNYIKTPDGKRKFDAFKPKVPVLGKLIQKIYMARFARTLGALLGSGVHMLEALAVVRDAVNNTQVADVITASIEQVRGGKALSSTLENNPHFLPLVPQMLKIGEESGTTDDMLERLAATYEGEVDEEVKNLSTTIEPVMMVVLGLMVGFIIIAIFGPVYGLVGGGVDLNTPAPPPSS